MNQLFGLQHRRDGTHSGLQQKPLDTSHTMRLEESMPFLQNLISGLCSLKTRK